MTQPEDLKTDDVYPWAWGRGNDVWAMLSAAAAGDLARVKQLAKRDATLLRCAYGYRTPLHCAVRENRLEVVSWLLSKGIDATYRSGSKWHDPPLQMAEERGYNALAARLRQHLAEQHGIAPAGDAIAAAIRARDQARTMALLGESADAVHLADERGNRPLHWAVMTRQLALIDWLLDHGAEIDAARPDGARPIDLSDGDYWYRGWTSHLHADALRTHWVVIGHLLARGATYDLVTATRIGDIERVRTLLGESPELANTVPRYSTWYSGFPLRTAARHQHREIVALLLAAGADPNHCEHGLAPNGGALHTAAANNNLEIARLLLEAGADPNQEVESSANALGMASGEEMRQLLRSYGATEGIWQVVAEGMVEILAARLHANPDLANDLHAFSDAAARGDEDLVRIFLRYQPDLWSRMSSRAGQTPETTRRMFAAGMDPSGPNWLGVTPLHEFAMSGDAANLALFLDHGAAIEAVDAEHRSTPLGWAAKHGRRDTAELLLQRGAAVDGGGAEWARPLAWARRRGHVEVADLLSARGAG